MLGEGCLRVCCNCWYFEACRCFVVGGGVDDASFCVSLLLLALVCVARRLLCVALARLGTRIKMKRVAHDTCALFRSYFTSFAFLSLAMTRDRPLLCVCARFCYDQGSARLSFPARLNLSLLCVCVCVCVSLKENPNESRSSYRRAEQGIRIRGS